MEVIWKQHTDEMEVIEGNIFKVAGLNCTIEFQPSADQSWQSCANNENHTIGNLSFTICQCLQREYECNKW